MLKIFGMILIIFASTKIGFFYASRLEKRKNTLICLKNAFIMLESEISFSQNAISKALENIASTMPEIISGFFVEVSQKISYQRKTVDDAWGETVYKYAPKFCLTCADVQVLKSFALQFGKSDIKNEIKNIHNTYTAINMLISDATNACDANKRMYQNAGILGGVLIAVILF